MDLLHYLIVILLKRPKGAQRMFSECTLWSRNTLLKPQEGSENKSPRFNPISAIGLSDVGASSQDLDSTACPKAGVGTPACSQLC